MYAALQNKPARQQSPTAGFAARRRAPSDQSEILRSLRQTQRTLGNQAVLRTLQRDADERDANGAERTPTGFGHDFRHLAVFAPAREAARPGPAVSSLPPGSDRPLFRQPQGEQLERQTEEAASSAGNAARQALDAGTIMSRSLFGALPGGGTGGAAPRVEDTWIPRKGCQPGVVLGTWDEQGKGCSAKAKIGVGVDRCVTACSDQDRLAEVTRFGSDACQKFCKKHYALSLFTAGKGIASKRCDSTPGECPTRCPKWNHFHASPRITEWNCKCYCYAGPNA